MTVEQLNRICTKKHISEYSFEELFTEFGLYEDCIIDTRDIKIVQIPDGQLVFSVSDDVIAFHELTHSMEARQFPCPQCSGDRTFNFRSINHPIKENTTSYKGRAIFPIGDIYSSINDGDEDQIVEKPVAPVYKFNRMVLGDYLPSAFKHYNIEEYKDEAARKCVEGILKEGTELRKDYCCGIDMTHRLFADFMIRPAVNDDDKPVELKAYDEKCRVARVNGDERPAPSEEEVIAIEAYKKASYIILLRKVGQSPSLADMQLFNTTKYRSVLKKDYRDLTMALGLFASGVGAGAFVYLRRIFENLVETAHQEAMTIPEWDDAFYHRCHFDERIDYLEKYGKVLIPNELGPIKGKLYGVLSKGIHISSEEECKELFPYMKFAIEIILDELIVKKEKEEKIKALNKKIASISNK